VGRAHPPWTVPFDGAHRLPLNFGGHAIHGVGFSRPWRIDRWTAAATLSLELPCDGYWPLVALPCWTCSAAHSLQMDLSVQAGGQRDAGGAGLAPLVSEAGTTAFQSSLDVSAGQEGIATLPRVEPTTGPWDDCFIADGDVTLIREASTCG
jgi:aldose 1-epimerase